MLRTISMGCEYFENRNCEYYPCHKAERINCLFCFCPLYDREDCGGNCREIVSGGKTVKDCSECLLPHTEGGYEYVINKLRLSERSGNNERKFKHGAGKGS